MEKIYLVMIWNGTIIFLVLLYFRDYEQLPELDTYDLSQIDDEEYDEIDPQAKLLAEKEIKKIRKNEMRGTNLEKRQRELLYGDYKFNFINYIYIRKFRYYIRII